MEKINNRQQQNVVDRRKCLESYLNTGKRIFPVKKGYKNPSITEWPNRSFTLEELEAHDGNYGWAIDDGFLVIDVDVTKVFKDNTGVTTINKDGLGSFKKLCEAIGIVLKPHVNSPSGGFHVYAKVPKGFKISKNLKPYPGIEFQQKKNYVLIPDSHLVEDKEFNQVEGFYTFTNILSKSVCKDAPETLIQHLLEIDGGKRTTKKKTPVAPLKTPENDPFNSDDEDDDCLPDNPLGLGLGATYDQVRTALFKIDPSCPYDEWFRILMGLKSWDKKQGLKLGIEWSEQSEKFKKGECEKKWKSFTVDGGIGIGTLFHLAKEYDPDFEIPSELEDNHEDFNEILAEIKQSNTQDIEKNIIPEIIENNFDDVKKSILGKAIQEAFKRETGLLPSIKTVRDLFKPAKTNPNWCDNWAYSIRDQKYFDFEKRTLIGESGFNKKTGRYIPENENGTKPYSSKYIADNGLVKDVDGLLYAPCEDTVILENNPYDEFDRKEYINSFDVETLPSLEAVTKEGLEFIETRIKPHLLLMWNTPDRVETMLNWLAYVTQRKKVALGWCVLLQSIQGIGKNTFFEHIVGSCIGIKNIRTVLTSNIESDFNGWAEGKMVSAINELLVSGADRRSIYNKIKPYISADDAISINKKGIEPYEITPVTNYLAFTNYKDCMNIDKDDRRFFITFNKFKDDKDLEKYILENFNLSRLDYYNSLKEGCKKFRGQIREYFNSFEISADFLNTIGNAPHTVERDFMVNAGESCSEGMSDVLDAIKENDSPYYNEDYVCSVFLWNDIFMPGTGELKTSQKNNLLRRMNYSPIKARVTIDGQKTHVWIKDVSLSLDDIKTKIRQKAKNKLDPDDWSFNDE